MLKRLLPLLAGIMITFVSGAQSVSRNDRIMLPPGVVEEKLDNGLSYIIMENDSPDRMIEMRLVFRAGSVLETEQNRGAAHFLEHLAFGGTKHFPGKKLIGYLESRGVQYGMGINAYITRQRLDRARQLLEQGDATITKISEQVGFSTPQYFSSKFSAAYGCTPSQYAERFRAKE